MRVRLRRRVAGDTVRRWQVSATIVKVDDNDAMIGSGNGSETRFRFTGSEELENSLTAGVTLEVGAGGEVYGYDDKMLDDGKARNDFRVRHANVSLSNAAGKMPAYRVFFGVPGESARFS